MRSYRHNQVMVDLSAIAHNYQLLQQATRVPVMPVIKANAYGHGMVAVAQKLAPLGVPMFAVALLEEAMCLRENGIKTPVLVLGLIPSGGYADAITHAITLTVCDAATLLAIDAIAKALQKKAHVHIKIDSGMNRIGVKNQEEAKALAQAIKQALYTQVDGVYTHFADADNPQKNGHMSTYTQAQLRTFEELRSLLGVNTLVHAANSAMSLLPDVPLYSMVREGISLYGYPPVPTTLSFQPALQWEADITWCKWVNEGDYIGYGCSFEATHPMRIATVCVGYGDGYNRLLSNKGAMLIHGQRAPIVGRVCMDQTMVDVTHIPQAQVGSRVTLLGTNGEDCISAEEIAQWCHTISYEVLLSIGERVRRVHN